VKKQVSETLLERWNINKNITREEFFQMPKRELARLEKPLHDAPKHAEKSKKKVISQLMPERSSD
jgi:hypothetical protein